MVTALPVGAFLGTYYLTQDLFSTLPLLTSMDKKMP